MATDLIVIGHGPTDLDVLGGAVTEFTEDQYIPMIGTDAPEYEGAYEVDARFYEQVIPTANKLLRDDMTFHAINYTEAPNDTGITVTIGG